MWRKNVQKFRLNLMLVAMNCLISCAREVCDESLKPVFPHAGPAVAAELQNLSAEEYADFWEWVGRLNKLRLELEN